jgi:hypothetical protein
MKLATRVCVLTIFLCISVAEISAKNIPKAVCSDESKKCLTGNRNLKPDLSCRCQESAFCFLGFCFCHPGNNRWKLNIMIYIYEIISFY